MEIYEYLETDRLNAFYDAIIAIIITVLVLELPQPTAPTLEAVLSLKISYFAYLLSFLVCVNLWQYHHITFRHVENIDNTTVWINILLLLVVSIIPYLTLFVADNFSSLVPQILYGLDYIIVDLILFALSYKLLQLNPENKYLKEAMNIKLTLIIPLIIFIISFIIGFLGYPEAISILCFSTIIMSIIQTIR